MDTLMQQIDRLKASRDALILAHYYVDGTCQDIADEVGDSYHLSRVAQMAEQQTIVVLGVRFMAESAKVLSPDKTILLPVKDADCPLAHMADLNNIRRVRSQVDDVAVVCYINSTLATKALSDVCVTSSNAERIIRKLPQHIIYFVPDRNLGHYLSGIIPEKHFILDAGFCPAHDEINADDIVALKNAHPDAKVLVHPECTPEVVRLADLVGSTSAIIVAATTWSASTYIVCTEIGVLHKLKKDRPERAYIFPKKTPICEDMKKLRPEDIALALRDNRYAVEIDPQTAKEARLALVRMHELAETDDD